MEQDSPEELVEKITQLLELLRRRLRTRRPTESVSTQTENDPNSAILKQQDISSNSSPTNLESRSDKPHEVNIQTDQGPSKLFPKYTTQTPPRKLNTLYTEKNKEVKENRPSRENNKEPTSLKDSTQPRSSRPVRRSVSLKYLSHVQQVSEYDKKKQNERKPGNVKEIISKIQELPQTESKPPSVQQPHVATPRNKNNKKDFEEQLEQNTTDDSTQLSVSEPERRCMSAKDLIPIEDSSYRSNPEPFATYKKVKGTKDFGREFEQAMCAYYALKLAVMDDVDDFAMTSNNAAYGKFDDIGVKVTFKNQTNKIFLFQLKHKESKIVNFTDLNSKGGKKDFNIQKYMKSISEINVNEDAIYILSTNSSTTFKDKTLLTDDISVEPCNHLELQDFLVNTEEGNENAIFEIKSESLKQKFYFFTSQMNVKKTEEKLNALLKNLLGCDIHGSFTSYIRKWWSGKFILTKHDVIAKISELALTPYLKPLTHEKCNEKTESLKQVITKFPLTIVEECSEDIIENIWKTEISHTDDKCSKTKEKYGLEEHQKSTILWYLGEVPLVVKVDPLNEVIIKCVMNFMLKGMADKKIVLSGKVSRSDCKLWYTLESLSDVMEKCKKMKCFSDIMQNFSVSFQGRGYITLENLSIIDADVSMLIGTRELLKMSQQKYLLVGNRREELSNSHIPRTLSPVFVKLVDIMNSYRTIHDTLIIINCDEGLLSRISENTIELSKYMSKATEREDVIVLSTGRKCTNVEFETICRESQKSNIYLFQHFDDGYCLLTLRKGKKFASAFTDTTRVVKENEIFKYYNNPLHVFCAPPGMGKSTLMQVLYTRCPSDCLAVYVNLINYNSFLATKPDFATILAHFLQVDGTKNDFFNKLKQRFLQKQKLYMFLDGLDELNSQFVETILNFVKLASSQIGNVWISSRENLREQISQTLNAVTVDIKALDKEEQEKYIELKLKEKYERKEIDKIAIKVFGNADLNKSQNLLGIPLQLYIITEMFLHDRQLYEKLEVQKIFVLSNMYKIYFQGKINFTYKKLVDETVQQQLGYLNSLLQNYEVPALKACLDEKYCKKLHLYLYENDVKDFLSTLKRDGDKFGIIKRINENDEAVFDHQTYAEYFACVWLKKNWNRGCRELWQDAIFAEKHENLRLTFDVMLAENNPLHLAVIYKDIEQFEEHIQYIDCKDERGRTVFHLAFSYGQKYPLFLKSTDTYFYRFVVPKQETSIYMKMIEKLLEQGKIPEEKDDLFDFDCVNYALQSGCLYPIEKILEKKLIAFNKLTFHKSYDRKAWAYFSAESGYPCLLSELIKEDRNLVNQLIGGNYLLELAVRECVGDVSTPSREKNVETVKILAKNGAIFTNMNPSILWIACRNKFFDIIDILRTTAKSSDGNTILHILVERCPEMYYNEIVSAIKELKIDVNARNHDGKTALHVAAESADLKIVDMLMKNGANLHLLDNENKNALDYASSDSRREAMKLFLDKGSSVK